MMQGYTSFCNDGHSLEHLCLLKTVLAALHFWFSKICFHDDQVMHIGWRLLWWPHC